MSVAPPTFLSWLTQRNFETFLDLNSVFFTTILRLKFWLFRIHITEECGLLDLDHVCYSENPGFEDRPATPKDFLSFLPLEIDILADSLVTYHNANGYYTMCEC